MDEITQMALEAPRIGVFVCDCGLNIAGTVDTTAVTEWAKSLPDVVAVIQNKYTCADPGQQEIQRTIYEHNLNRVVVASCSPTSYEAIFRQCIEGAGLNPYLLEMANIREHCSWVTPGDREAATQKAQDLVNVAVARARWLYPQDEEQIPVTHAALVIGGGVAGMQTALDRLNLIESYLGRIKAANPRELMKANETAELVKVARLTTRASMERKESGRGYYRRTDYPEMDPELNRPLIAWYEGGEFKFAWKDG